MKMLNKELSEQLAKVLSEISCIPTFNGALLLNDDIADALGFQIRCTMNEEGRTVFSVHGHTEGDMTYSESLYVFKQKFEEIHGNPVRELKKHDINTPNYPAMGADYAEDLSPATIIRIMRVTFETNNEELAGVIPAYIMRLTNEVEKWSAYFEKLAKKTRGLEVDLKEILEKSL
jgi:hypothetical protein